jgi:hypothetical protein
VGGSAVDFVPLFLDSLVGLKVDLVDSSQCLVITFVVCLYPVPYLVKVV